MIAAEAAALRGCEMRTYHVRTKEGSFRIEADRFDLGVDGRLLLTQDAANNKFKAIFAPGEWISCIEDQMAGERTSPTSRDPSSDSQTLKVIKWQRTIGRSVFRTKVTIELPGLWTQEQLSDVALDMIEQLQISLPYGGRRAGGELAVKVMGDVPQPSRNSTNPLTAVGPTD